MQLVHEANSEKQVLTAPLDIDVTAHRIRSVEIVGGFLDGARFEFADGLNCLIGARGAGKTTVVELIRYALDELPAHDTRDGERRRIETLVEHNLGGGRVQLSVETKEGLAYIVSRSPGEEPIVQTIDGEPTDISLKSGSLFRADIYSQNEIESIADRTSSQLELIDNFELEHIAEVNVRIGQLRTELAANASEIIPIQSRIAGLGEELGTLTGVEDKLGKLASHGGDNSDVINTAHSLKSLRDRERRTVEDAKRGLQAYAQQIVGLRKHAAVQTVCPDDITAGPNGQTVTEAMQHTSRCVSVVEKLLAEAEAEISRSLDEISIVVGTLSKTHGRQELAFRSLIEKHEHAQGQAAERSKLERHRNELLAKRSSREQLESQLSELLKARDRLLETMSELQDERYSIRQNITERVNESLGPAIRVTVLQHGEPEQYRRLLEEGLRSARLRHLVVAQKLANTFWPGELSGIVRQGDAAQLVDRAELNPEQADKVIAALSDSSLLFELESVELADLPRIELKDGDTYKDSLKLSTGQKCTTILPLLLLESENPLLVDQPEDNLDNRFIFETVVDSIRQVKQQRQLIFVTHNPNIPVLGDAERVFVLNSNGASSCMAREGTVDECKVDIVTLLEGGEDAFKARKTRYAY